MGNKTIPTQGIVMENTRKYHKTMFADFPDVVTVGEMAKMLKVSAKTAYKILKEDKIKHIAIGRAYKIPKIRIIEFLLNSRQNG